MNYKECFLCRKMIPKDNKGVYCDECKSKISNDKQEYSVKKETEKVYKSITWKKVREEALKRSGYKCEVCVEKGRVTQAKDVHHIIKVSDGDSSTHYNLDNLVCVCDRCHKEIEGMNKHELLIHLLKLSDDRKI